MLSLFGAVQGRPGLIGELNETGGNLILILPGLHMRSHSGIDSCGATDIDAHDPAKRPLFLTVR